MARTRASAKSSGASFERLIADALAVAMDDNRIDRKVKSGAQDKGDIANVRVGEQKVVIECKEYGGRILASEWIGETEVERVNDGALAGFAVIKRKGTTDPLQQYVLLTLGEMIALLNGNRHHYPKDMQ